MGDWADHMRGAAKQLAEQYPLRYGISAVIEGTLPYWRTVFFRRGDHRVYVRAGPGEQDCPGSLGNHYDGQGCREQVRGRQLREAGSEL